MRSGFEGNRWEDEYYQSSLRCVDDFSFVQHTFEPGPALVEKAHGTGHSETPFSGQAFDPDRYEVVQGAWDHDHCYVCEFRFEGGYTFWQNTRGIIVCDVCHEYVQSTKQPASE